MTRLILLLVFFAAMAGAEPFTYQGQLSDSGNLANGDYDFVFRLYDGSDPNTASLQGSAMVVDDLSVRDGVFTATIDPGILLDGTPLWLEVSVRPGNTTGGYTQLLPLQPITAAPEAQVSLSVVADAIGSSQIANGSIANADLAGNIDPAKISGTAWTQAGNSPAAGVYLGTNNTEPLELRVNGKRVGVITDAVDISSNHAPNVLLGAENNVIDPAVSSATVGGGSSNAASGSRATVGGGYSNAASGSNDTVGGGYSNTASGSSSTVGGGSSNTASGGGATVGGGEANTASALFAMVPGGSFNQAGGRYSFAAGRRAKVRDAATVGGIDLDGDEGTFVWADSTDADFVSTGPNQFLVRASGGIWFGTNSSPSISSGQFIATSTGAHLTTGGTWTNSSDRNRKTNFQPIDPQAVLEKVVSLPILRWNYKEEDEGTLHLGPMAQDFHAAFGLGADDKHIATVDADGVALAAIQALAQENQALQARLSDQEQQLQAQQQENRQQAKQLAVLLADRETQQQQLAQLQQALEALQANQQQLLARLRQAEGEANTQEPAQ